jgi:hypothetical protein
LDSSVTFALRFVAAAQPKSANMTRCPAIEARERAHTLLLGYARYLLNLRRMRAFTVVTETAWLAAPEREPDPTMIVMSAERVAKFYCLGAAGHGVSLA